MNAEVNAYAATSSQVEQRHQYVVLVLGIYCGQAMPEKTGMWHVRN